jgi:hypothetical protein
MTEYIIIVALVAIAAIGVYSAFGDIVRGQASVALSGDTRQLRVCRLGGGDVVPVTHSKAVWAVTSSEVHFSHHDLLKRRSRLLYRRSHKPAMKVA